MSWWMTQKLDISTPRNSSRRDVSNHTGNPLPRDATGNKTPTDPQHPSILPVILYHRRWWHDDSARRLIAVKEVQYASRLCRIAFDDRDISAFD